MKTRHIIKHAIWNAIVRIAMYSHQLQSEYQAYCARALETGRAAFDQHQWLHRRWFPGRYAYEYACPDCGGNGTSYGLCMDCGERWDIGERPARPM